MKFRLTLKSKYYFNIHVFDSKEYMWKYAKEDGFGAIVKPYVIVNDITGEKKKCLGDAYFYKGNIGAGLMAHEMLHCAMWYDRIINSNNNAEYSEKCSDKEERLAYILTELVTKLNRKLWKLGAYE